MSNYIKWGGGGIESIFIFLLVGAVICIRFIKLRVSVDVHVGLQLGQHDA